MKKLDFGQAVTILANVGVIAGIIFLAIEIRQNNELMMADARFNRASNAMGAYELQAKDPVIAPLLVKDRNGELLTEEEEFRIQSFWMRVLKNLEWALGELPDDTTWVEGQRKNFAAYGSYQRTWEGGGDGLVAGGRSYFNSDFVKFMEENIVNR